MVCECGLFDRGYILGGWYIWVADLRRLTVGGADRKSRYRGMADMLVQNQMGYQSKLKCDVLSAVLRFSSDDYKMLLMFVTLMLTSVVH